MYQIIVNAGWSSESLYGEYNNMKDAQKAKNKLVDDGVYNAQDLCIVTKYQGGNVISGDNYGL